MSTLFEKPRWATGGSADIVEPSEGKKDLGWVGGGEKPPHETFNWLLRRAYDWINNLADNAAGYDDVADFVANSEGGDFGLIRHEGAFGENYSREASLATGNAVTAVYSDSAHLLTGEADASVTLRDRLTLAQTSIGAFAGSYTFTNFSATAPVDAIHSNGKFVAAVADVGGGSSGEGEVWNKDDGTSLLTFSHNVSLQGVCQDGFRVYFSGAESLSAGIRAFDFATQTQQWTYTHGGTVHAICTDGIRLYAVGTDADGTGTSAVGSNLLALDVATGALIWEVAMSGFASLPNTIATNGDIVAVSNGTNGFELRDAVTGEVLAPASPGSQQAMTVDRDFRFSAGLTGSTGNRNRNNMNRYFGGGSVPLNGPLIDSVGVDARDIHTDSELIFVGQEEDAGDGNNSLISYRCENKNRTFERIDPDNPPTFWPLQLLALPTGN